MNIVLWILQWTLAALTLFSFLSTPFLVRRGLARRPVTAILMSVVGLSCGIALVLPWLTGQVRALTPVAAGVMAIITVVDSLTNRLDASDVAYNVAVVVMAVAVAAGRAYDLAPSPAPTFFGWAVLVGGVALMIVAIAGARAAVVSSVRWAQALFGIAAVLAGIRNIIDL